MVGWNSLFVAAHIKLILRRLEIFGKGNNSVCNVGIQGWTRNWVGHWPTCPSPFPPGLRTLLLLCCSSYAAMLGPGPALLAWRHCHLTGNCWPLGQPPTQGGAKMSPFGKHIHTLRGPNKHGGSTVCKEYFRTTWRSTCRARPCRPHEAARDELRRMNEEGEGGWQQTEFLSMAPSIF